MMTFMDLSDLKEINRRQQEGKEMGYVVIRDLPRQEKIHKMQRDKTFWENIEKANEEIGQRVGKNDVTDWSKRELKPMCAPETATNLRITGDRIIDEYKEKLYEIYELAFENNTGITEHSMIRSESGRVVSTSYGCILATIEYKGGSIEFTYSDLFVKWKRDHEKKEVKPVLGTLEDYEKQEAGKLRKIYSNPIFNRISDRELLEYVKLEKQLKEKEVKLISIEPVKECKSCGAFDFEFKNDNYYCSYCGRRFVDDSK